MTTTIDACGADFKYIEFVELPSKGKTSIWSCRNKNSGTELGQVRWHGPWRQYCYFPAVDAVYSSGCLFDIGSFVSFWMKERRDPEK
jgi:hypothetical protein